MPRPLEDDPVAREQHAPPLDLGLVLVAHALARALVRQRDRAHDALHDRVALRRVVAQPLEDGMAQPLECVEELRLGHAVHALLLSAGVLRGAVVVVAIGP